MFYRFNSQWDWSLRQLSQRCLTEAPGFLVVRASRAFHLAHCGIHFKGNDCNNASVVNSLPTLTAALAGLRLAREAGSLYPKELQVMNNELKPGFVRETWEVRPNGGWADPRDRDLCLSFNSNE